MDPPDNKRPRPASPQPKIKKLKLTINPAPPTQETSLSSYLSRINSPSTPGSLKAFFCRILKAILSAKDSSTGTNVLAEAFLNTPPKPENVSERPYGFDKIIRKVENSRYSSVDSFRKDVAHLFSFFKQVHPQDAQPHKDAVELESLFESLITTIEPPTPSSKPPKRSKSDADLNSASSSLSSTPAPSAYPDDPAHPPPQETPVKQEQMNPKQPSSSSRRSTMPAETAQMFDAVSKGDIKRVERLAPFIQPTINQLFPVSMFGSKFTWGIIHAASHHGNPEIIDILIRHGANIELEDTWYHGRPLAWAAFSGHLNLCKTFIDKYGVNKFAVNKVGQTAFELIGDNMTVKEWVDLLADEETKRNYKPPPQQHPSQRPARATRGSPSRAATTSVASASTKTDIKPVKSSSLTVKLQAPSVVAAAAAAASNTPLGVSTPGSAIPGQASIMSTPGSAPNMTFKIPSNADLSMQLKSAPGSAMTPAAALNAMSQMQQFKHLTPAQIQQLQLQLQLQAASGSTPTPGMTPHQQLQLQAARMMMTNGRPGNLTPVQLQQLQQFAANNALANAASPNMMSPDMMGMMGQGGTPAQGAQRRSGRITRQQQQQMQQMQASAMNANLAGGAANAPPMPAVVPDNLYTSYMSQVRTHASQVVPNSASDDATSPTSSSVPLVPPQHPLIASIGIVSNDDKLRMVIPLSPDDVTHHHTGHVMTIQPTVTSVNIRVVMSQDVKFGDIDPKTVAMVKYACMGYHSYTASSNMGAPGMGMMPMAPKLMFDAMTFGSPGSNTNAGGVPRTGDIQDCASTLRDGVNTFEIVVVMTLMGKGDGASAGSNDAGESMVVLDEMYQSVVLTVNRP